NIGGVIALSVILWVIDGELRSELATISGIVAGAAASVIVSTMYFGQMDVWIRFAASLPRTLATAWYPLEHGNLGLTSLVRHAMSITLPSYVVLVAVAGAFVYIAATTRRRRGDARTAESTEESRLLHQAFTVVGAGCAMMLLSGTLVWLHYYL